jgi:GT2 family glycosyltransferase
MTNVTALIVGIEGWDKYTLPLIESLKEHEPGVQVVVIDNASTEPYPRNRRNVHRTERLSYSAAINRATLEAKNPDWYLVLSNDVLCTGPFVETLEKSKPCVMGPCLKKQYRWEYIEGWCVAAHAAAWRAIGGWDGEYEMASWADVDFCASAVKNGYQLKHMPAFPFTHLGQGQRIHLPRFYEADLRNRQHFLGKWG